MKSKTLLITSTGLVGSYLYEVFGRKSYPVTGTSHSIKGSNASCPVDICRKDSLEKVFEELNPRLVILAAALTDVDYCETHRDEARQVNVEGVRNVAGLCRDCDARMVFFSSDYVFDGENGPYAEEDTPNPVCFYGKTKLEGEQIVRKLVRDHLIIRTTGVYGNEEQKKNFAIRLINTLRNNNVMGVPSDQVSSPTYALSLAELTEELVARQKHGVYNIAGRDRMNRYAFALEICSEFSLNQELVIPVRTEELKQAAKRPLNSGLKTDKVSREAGRGIPGARESLRMFREETVGEGVGSSGQAGR